MKLNEAVALLSIIKAAYPKAYRDMSEEDALSTAGLWAEMFKNETLEIVATAGTEYQRDKATDTGYENVGNIDSAGSMVSGIKSDAQ